MARKPRYTGEEGPQTTFVGGMLPFDGRAGLVWELDGGGRRPAP